MTLASTVTYDANGNTLTDPSGKQYSWDFDNRLTSATVPGTGTTTFRYDPFGRRIQKSGPLGTTNVLYDSANLLEEVDNAGNVLARYTQGAGIDEPLSEFRAGTTSYYQQDGLGSISSLTNATGMLANSYTFDSFGQLTAHTGTLVNSFQYAGREFDSETSIYFNRARYYDPSAGRFLSEDPIYSRGGLNFYGYVRNNPANWLDPSGLAPGWWNNIVNWWNPPPPPPISWPTPPAPPIPLKCQFSGQCDFTPDMNASLDCFQNCLGRRPTITCGRGGHGPNDPHSRGEGADYGANNNSWLTRDQVTTCFDSCFKHSYCQEEYNNGNSGPTHWHLQFTPGRNGGTGCSDTTQPHGK